MIKNKEQFNSNLPASFDGKFEWEFLLPIFGDTHIAPMDIDACLEKNDYVLIMETKHDCADIPMGQRRTFRSLHRRGGLTLLYIWMDGDKDSNKITMVQILQPGCTDFLVKEFFNGEGQLFVYGFVETWYLNSLKQNYYDTI